MTRCVVSCGYSEGRGNYYRHHADRLELSLDKYGAGESRIIWRNSWPPLSPSHQKLHYSFKFYAVQEAKRRGHRYVLWLDAGSCLTAPIEPLWKLIEEHGCLLLMGTTPLGQWISDKALQYFGVDREYAFKHKLAGGCFIGLDLEHPTGKRFYDEWERLAKQTKLFWCSGAGEAHLNGVLKSVPVSDGDHNEVISFDPRVLGHRSDEACFSIMIQQMGLKTLTLTEWKQYMKTYGQDLVVVDNHSVWMDEVGSGPVLDAGCRGFRFADYFAKRGNPVVMMDPAPDEGIQGALRCEMPSNVFFRKALVPPGYPKSAKLRMTEDLEARNVVRDGEEGDPVIECMTIQEVMEQSGVTQFDLVKLNIEGMETAILESWPGLIAKQIVVSFHQHTPQAVSSERIANVMEYLKKWYRVVRHERDERYQAGWNWWDTVLIDRNIL